MKKVFAFLLMTDQGPEETRTLPGERMDTLFLPVRSLQEGCDTVRRLVAEQGLGAVELCGAFGEEKCRELIERTGNRMAIGFSVHLPFQDGLFDAFFGA